MISWKEPITWATIVIALAAIINLFISYFMWDTANKNIETTEKLFIISHRPYLGVKEIVVDKNEKEKDFWVTYILKNSGNVPAINVQYDPKIYVNEKLNITELISNKPIAVIPDDSTKFKLGIGIGISPNDFSKVISGEYELEVDLGISYGGLRKEKFKTRHKGIYYPKLDRIAVLESTME